MVNLREYLQQFLFFIKGYESYVILLLVLSVIIGLIDAASIALLYPMISVGFQISSDSVPYYGAIEEFSDLIPIGSPFVHFGLLFIILTVISLCLQLLYWKIVFIFQRSFILNLKQKIFLKIDSNDFKFFVDSKQGDLINLFNQSPFYVQQSYDRILCICTDLITSITIFIMLFFVSPEGLILVLIGGLIFYFVINYIGKNISEKLGFLQIASGQSENKVINEYINGIKPIKALNASETWRREYFKALKLYWDKFSDFMFIQRVPIIIINSLFYISIGIIVLLLYVYYANNFFVIIPVIGTFAAGIMKILPKIMNMGTYKMELLNFLPHLRKIYSLLQEKKYLSIKNGILPCDDLNSDIYLNKISFSYGHGKILNNVSLTIKKGKMTAIVGPSGSGKSTIVNLLLRLYDPNTGSIRINGVDLRELDINSYRNIIGYVSQDPFVYNTSIRENIEFGGHFSDIELIDAAKLAYAHDFITNLPNGYDTVVGDQGLILSGGEKQRIVIARAMIRHPELLILDEATSSLDNISETAVQKAIDQVAKECTTLVIAHRLTTIRNANTIYVLENGEITEYGSHTELFDKKGMYFDLHQNDN